jgi:hypothetical protein
MEMNRSIFLIAAGLWVATTFLCFAESARAQDVTLNAPVGTFTHVAVCKHESPCDKFKVTIPFTVLSMNDFVDDMNNSNFFLFFGNGSCGGSFVFDWESDVTTGFSAKATRKSIKWTFNGTTTGFNSQQFNNIFLKITITLKSNGTGVLKASGTADLSSLPGSGLSAGFGPFDEPPDSDDSMNVNSGDFNCSSIAAIVKGP